MTGPYATWSHVIIQGCACDNVSKENLVVKNISDKIHTESISIWCEPWRVCFDYYGLKTIYDKPHTEKVFLSCEFLCEHSSDFAV